MEVNLCSFCYFCLYLYCSSRLIIKMGCWG